MVTYLDVLVGDTGQRLDNYLMRALKGVPRQHIYKVIRSGEVRVNGSRARANSRINVGDRIRIPPMHTRQDVAIKPAEGLQSRLLNNVLFEDDDVLALDKPAGVAVHGGTSVRSGVVEQLRLAQNNPRLELVHRLDRDTSGCLLLAKKPSVLKQLQAEFRARRVKKIYELIVIGRWPQKVRVVNERLERYQTSSGERRVRVSVSGQAAQTDFEVLSKGRGHTWLRARLHTGRTHQIRVHALSQRCPIVGDEKYLPTERGAGNAAEGLMLHATRLHVPWSGEMLKLESPVAARFTEFWQHVQEG